MPSEKTSLLSRAKKWYAKFERPFSSISLIGGFVFDALTLTRVDMFWENFWVVTHLAIVTICAVIINLIENEPGAEADPEKLHFWLVNIMQFFFGGIFSTFLVFYFRSGSITTSWPFLVILAAAFIANERLKHHYARLAFQISQLFLSYYVFAIYVLPILFHEISTRIFLLSGVASLAMIAVIIIILRYYGHERFKGKSARITYAAIIVIVIGVNTLYFYNLIPPLPLSLKDAGIYQSLIVNGPGLYTVESEDQGPFAFFDWSQTIHMLPNGKLYAYTAIFSPTSLDTNIVHLWQYYDPAQKAWITRARVVLAVAGGRDGGYRTYSTESGIIAGSWRVNVETQKGQLIGQLRFDVITTSTPATLTTENID
jgi:hypothetical protein